ncbi:MAG: L-threonylcarbamoyladenylate synthase [Clostridia bacterium]
MKTKLFKIESATDKQIDEVAQLLKAGEVVAVPTETVYGLAANALSSESVKKIFTAKGRPSDNPLILHISDISQWKPLVKDIPPLAMKLAETFWGGALTIILEKSDLVPKEVCGGLNTVAVRMPDNALTCQIISRAGVPLAAPSANTSGKPSPTTASHVLNDLDGKIAAIVDGGACKVGVESTVVSLAVNPPRLLRPGGITPEMLKTVIPDLVIDNAVFAKLENNKKATSPGMKYKHYSPKAEVIILKGSFERYKKYVGENADNNDLALCFEGEETHLEIKTLTFGKINDPSSQATALFDALRKVDELNAAKVYARYPSDSGVGLAVFNRLLRAAEFNVIELD